MSDGIGNYFDTREEAEKGRSKMKLRNKRTGEVVKVVGFDQSYGEIKMRFINEDNVGKLYITDSLTTFNSDWEDYEEPKEPKYYWYIGYKNDIRRTKYHHISDFADNQVTVTRKEIGNCFESLEEAEKAVEKLKAWKRLKDKGFEFCKYSALAFGEIEFRIPDFEGWSDSETEQVKEDLDLLFGGEE